MSDTSPTLLQQLRSTNEPQAWARFVDLYAPLLLAWARQMGLQPDDAADLVQEVFAHLVVQLPKFQYDPSRKSFRGWLRTVCLNKWRDRKRLKAANAPNAPEKDLADLEGSNELERFWSEEHDRYLVGQALEGLQALREDFQAPAVEVCWEVVVNGRPAAEVARQFGMTDNAVYLARLRVLRRLRHDLAEFLE